MNCSACNKTLSADAKVYKCGGHGDDMECDHNYEHLCEACVSYDANEDTYHCSDCFEMLYFTCDVCKSVYPWDNNHDMGNCYAEQGCGCESICKHCFVMPDDADGMCINCYEKLYVHCTDCGELTRTDDTDVYQGNCNSDCGKKDLCKECCKEDKKLGPVCVDCYDELNSDGSDAKCFWCNSQGCDKQNANGKWVHTDCE